MTRRGFTILETLLALALLVILAAGVLGFIGSLTDRREVVARVTDDMAAADALFDRLERDVLTSLAGGGWLGAGLSGDDRSISIVSRQSFVDAGGDDPGAEAFRTTVEWNADTGRLTGGHRSLTGGSGLGSSDLSERVERLQFRYHDGDAWRERFDSSSVGRLPLAIEVAVWFGEPAAAEDEAESDAMLDEPIATLDDLGAFEDEDDIERAPDRVRVIAVPGSERFGERGAR